MKLFQQLLVASAAVSMLAPVASQASSVNLKDMNSYSAGSQSADFTNNYLNVQPGDWAHQSIKDLVKSRGCDINVSDKSLTRFEAATIVNSCLGNVAEVTNVERSLIDEFSSELALLRGRIDGIEARMNEYDAGSFSSTTTLDGKAVFIAGAVDGNSELTSSKATLNDAVHAGFVYQMNLNTSFTGDDNLYVRLKTGNGLKQFSSKPGNYLNETNTGDGSLKVDKIWYTFPIGDRITGTIGPKIENYYMLAAAPSAYKPKLLKAFRFGGHGAAFGASTSTGLGLKYDADNGFASSVTINSKGANGGDGFLTDDDENKLNVMAAYTADNYHVSATYTTQSHGWDAWSYYSTSNITGGDKDSDGWALRAWFRPDETGTAVPSVSIGYDRLSFTNSNTAFTDANGYSVAFNWEDIFQADDTIGVAFGQPMKGSEPTAEAIDPFLWEAYYSFRPNDSIEIMPGVFGGSDVQGDTSDDIFGAIIQTTFKF